ncbi:MAG TPA: hypothetical protein VKT82_11665 [Ktedonobacterales bacterium]|nr:hypothetical protein [Ktedonobacterales bacterium]
MRVVAIHPFALAFICGIVLLLAIGIAVLVYFVVRATTRQRNIP